MDTSSNVEQIKVNFRQEENTGGWIDLHVGVNTQKLCIQASYVFSPFESLIHFLENILSNRLPSIFEWDEEGKLKRFNAQPHENPELVRFFIDSPSHLQGFPIHTYMEGVFQKKQFVAEFYGQFVRFLSSAYDKKKWVCGKEELDLTRINLNNLKSLLHAK